MIVMLLINFQHPFDELNNIYKFLLYCNNISAILKSFAHSYKSYFVFNREKMIL
jgi:hypothetical protein